MDKNEILGFFLLDSKEQIESISNHLIVLEREPQNLPIVNELFRAIHSLKGASATMGFTAISELTHVAEDMLDALRNKKLTVTSRVVDILLAVTDRVEQMLTQVENDQTISIKSIDLIDEIKAFSNMPTENVRESNKVESLEKTGLIHFELSEDEQVCLEEERMDGKNIYQLELFFEKDCIMPSVRAIMVLKTLENMGKIIKQVPDCATTDLNNKDVFSVLLAVDSEVSLDSVKTAVLGVSEISDVVLTFFTSEEHTQSIESECEVKKENGAENKATIQEDSSKQITTLRVDIARMDNLINLVGEMVITRTRLVQLSSELKTEFNGNQNVNNLDEANAYLGRLMNELQESVMRLRMVSVGTVFSRFPRLVRDLSRKTGKRVELKIYGEDTELDKTVIESIGDPLLHIIRNSVDHGIEPTTERLAQGKTEYGTVTLNAYHEGNHVIISIKDDGAGLNLAKIKEKAINKGLILAQDSLSDKEIMDLIFAPGFSTAEAVTDISGRGVGMDVVKRVIESLNGTVDIETKAGQGTTFVIKLPLTLAIIQALLVQLADEVYAIPLASVSETLLVDKKQIKQMSGIPVMILRESTIPLIELRDKFNVPGEKASKDEEQYVVVVEDGKNKVGLIVDELKGQQEIVIKSLDESIKNTKGIAGATILGNGQVTLIIDVASLLK